MGKIMEKNIAFFSSFFPRKTETFINNELIILKNKGLNFKVISIIKSSDKWVRNVGMKNLLKNDHHATGYLVLLRGLIKGLTKPKLFIKHANWVLSLKHKNKLFALRVISALLVAYSLEDYIKTENIKYLHANFASYPTEIAMCLSHITGIPYGGTWHAFDIWRDANILSEKIFYAYQILTCTQYNLEHLVSLTTNQGVVASKVRRIYHGVNFNSLPSIQAVEENLPLLAVGRLIPKKGFCYLIDALGLLKQQGVYVKLNIIGFPRAWLDRVTSGEGSELNRIKSKIRHYKLENQVSLLGYKSHQEVFAVMNQSFALVMPSVRDKKNNIDGIPNVILEAMALQRPVVATAISGIPEVVINGQTGLLVEPENSDQLASAIKELLGNIEYAKSLGQNARRNVLEKFDIDENVNVYFDCLSKTIC